MLFKTAIPCIWSWIICRAETCVTISVEKEDLMRNRLDFLWLAFLMALNICTIIKLFIGILNLRIWF